MTKKISTKDARTHKTYRTDFDMVFDWLPFIGSQAFALYSLYLALSENGRSMGVRTIAQRLAMSPYSVSGYTTMLLICELIEVETGNNMQANTITIVNPPRLDHQQIYYIMTDIRSHSQLPQFVKVAMDKRAARWQPMPTTAATPTPTAPYLNGNSSANANADGIGVANLVSQLQRVCQKHGSNNGAYFDSPNKWINSGIDRALLASWLDAIDDHTVDLVKIDGVAGWIRSRVENGEQPPQKLIPVNPVERIRELGGSVIR